MVGHHSLSRLVVHLVVDLSVLILLLHVDTVHHVLGQSPNDQEVERIHPHFEHSGVGQLVHESISLETGNRSPESSSGGESFRVGDSSQAFNVLGHFGSDLEVLEFGLDELGSFLVDFGKVRLLLDGHILEPFVKVLEV